MHRINKLFIYGLGGIAGVVLVIWICFWGLGRERLDGMLVFGDSLSDVGNSYIMSGKENPGEEYYEGRFSNGRLWIELFAEGMGFEETRPSLAGGKNYSFGGARTGIGEREGKPDIGKQVEEYLEKNGGKVDRRKLIVVSGGCNDFIRGNPIKSIPNIVGNVTKLAMGGGRVFLVTNFPPLGCLPVFTHELPVIFEASMVECLECSVDPEIHKYLEGKVGSKIAKYLKRWIPSVKEYMPAIKNYLPTLVDEFAKRFGGYAGAEIGLGDAGKAALDGATAISGMYNDYLELALSDLERRLGIKIYRLDLDGIFRELSTNPGKYGFTCVDAPAVDPKTHEVGSGVNVDEYMFFDGIHPSRKTHQYLGEAALRLFGR